MCCAGELVLQLLYDVDQPKFEILNSTEVSGNCTDNELNNFRDFYVDFFQNNLTGKFEYDIQESMASIGSYLVLSITNPIGDTIKFYNTPHHPLAYSTVFDVTTWYLISTHIDGNNSSIPPAIAQTLTAEFSINGGFEIHICDLVSGHFSLTEDLGNYGFFYILCNALEENIHLCSDTDKQEIQDLVHNFFNENIDSHFAYYNTDDSNYEYFTIESSSGDKLTFSNHILATDTFNQINVITYPNPVKDIVYIEVPDTFHITSITLLDLQGCIFPFSTDANSTISIDVSHLKSGVYFLQLETSKGVVNKKILKQ